MREWLIRVCVWIEKTLHVYQRALKGFNLMVKLKKASEFLS